VPSWLGHTYTSQGAFGQALESLALSRSTDHSIPGGNVDQLHLMRAFVAVVDANGFAGGARALKLSAPSVTRAVNELESRLGVRLLNRTTRVVRVTEPGARYADDCRRILAELAVANDSVAGLHSTPTGQLTLTAPVLLAPGMSRPSSRNTWGGFPMSVPNVCSWTGWST